MNMLDAKQISGESSYIRHSRKRAIPEKKIVYPDSDGKQMADNTKQFDWIVKIKVNLDQVFADNPDVFVAGDLLWYPVEGNPKIRIAPDAMVVFGRPKGHRGYYRMWEEDNIAPQAVFEILSPGNTAKEMAGKLVFYEKYGVSEYYVYDPDRIALTGYIRKNAGLSPIKNMQGWISPLLKIRFDIGQEDLYIYHPDGEKFLSPLENNRLRRSAQRETLIAQIEAGLAKQKAEAEYLRAERLAAKLRELGIENGY